MLKIIVMMILPYLSWCTHLIFHELAHLITAYLFGSIITEVHISRLKLAKEKNRWRLAWSNKANAYIQFYPQKATYINDKKLMVSSLAIYSSGIIVNILSLAILALCIYNITNTMYAFSFSLGGAFIYFLSIQ